MVTIQTKLFFYHWCPFEFKQTNSVSKAFVTTEKIKYKLVNFFHIRKRILCFITSSALHAHKWCRKYWETKVSLRYETSATKMPHLYLNSSSETEIKFIYWMYLIENGWYKILPHDPHHNGKFEKKRFWGTPLILAYPAPGFLGGKIASSYKLQNICSKKLN